MEDKLHIGVAKITNAINKRYEKVGFKKLVFEKSVRRALKANKMRHIKVGKAYAMRQSWINSLADPNCELFTLEQIAEQIGISTQQAKNLRRKKNPDSPINLFWLDQFWKGGPTLSCQNSVDNFRHILETNQNQNGKRGRPRKLSGKPIPIS